MSTFEYTSNLKDTITQSPGYSIPERIYSDEPQDSTPADHLISEPSTADEKVAPKAPKYALASSILEPLRGKYRLLQLWEGRVLTVRDSEFEAIVVDKTNPSFPKEIVTVGKEELSPDDLPLADPGSVFYWSIGYVVFPGRGRSRESKIRFRRLQGWTETEFKRAEKFGERLEKLFNNDID